MNFFWKKKKNKTKPAFFYKDRDTNKSGVLSQETGVSLLESGLKFLGMCAKGLYENTSGGGAGEMNKRLTALAALLQDLGSIPSSSTTAHNHL